MKASKYNKSRIMSMAHKFYKNCRDKYSTFSDALKRAWEMAKWEVKKDEQLASMRAKENEIAERSQKHAEQAAIDSILFKARQESKRIMAEANAKVERMRLETETRNAMVSYEVYVSRIASAMGYGSGKYIGD